MEDISMAVGTEEAPRYRLFIDEIGNTSYSSAGQDENDRFFSLAGVMLELM